MKVVDDLSIRELRLLAALPRVRSIRSFAAELAITPQALSKNIQRLEELLRVSLLQRSAVGVVPSSEARELSLWARGVLAKVEGLESFSEATGATQFRHTLTFGTRAFMNTLLSGSFLKHSELAKIGWRFIDLSPHETVEAARRGGLQVAVSLGKLPFPDDWRSEKVGELVWSLYVRQGHPIAAVVQASELAAYDFTFATYWDGTSVVRGEDFSPIKGRERRFGYGIQTAHTAIEVALASDHIVNVPRPLARPFVERQELREVTVRSGHPQSHEVYLAVQADLVSASLQRQLVRTIGQRLKEK